MRAFSAILCGGTAIVLLSGCVGYRDYGDSHRGGYYNGAYLGGYYDGYYGPYSGGYWASDGYFYYMDRNHHYRRDNNRHFRRNRFPGSKPIRAGDRGRDRMHDGNRDRRDRNDGYQ
jgi:hypothetical protein